MKKEYWIGIGVLIVIFFLFKEKIEALFGGIGKSDPGQGSMHSASVDGESLPSGYDAGPAAAALFNAMKDVGTDEGTILSVLESNNGAQLVAIYNKFGSPRYWLTGESLIGDKVDLFGWIRNEVDSNMLTQLQAIWNAKVVTKFN